MFNVHVSCCTLYNVQPSMCTHSTLAARSVHSVECTLYTKIRMFSFYLCKPKPNAIHVYKYIHTCLFHSITKPFKYEKNGANDISSMYDLPENVYTRLKWFNEFFIQIEFKFGHSRKTSSFLYSVYLKTRREEKKKSFFQVAMAPLWIRLNMIFDWNQTQKKAKRHGER